MELYTCDEFTYLSSMLAPNFLFPFVILRLSMRTCFSSEEMGLMVMFSSKIRLTKVMRDVQAEACSLVNLEPSSSFNTSRTIWLISYFIGTNMNNHWKEIITK